jgi:thioredoxin-related protein
MLSRRSALALSLCALSVRQAGAQAPTKPRLGEDGLHHFDWYLESFLDIAEDIAAARQNGKRLVVMWGLKGCPACRRMHEAHLSHPATQTFVRRHFEVLHLNILGAREVTALSGRKLPEKAFAEAEGVRSTPTLQFMPTSPDAAGEAVRLDRLPDVPTFKAFFRFVHENGYEAGDFDSWFKRQA